MWVNYFPCQFGDKKWRVRVHKLPMYDPFLQLFPSESCMMIPGTYAQMRADYD